MMKASTEYRRKRDQLNYLKGESVGQFGVRTSYKMSKTVYRLRRNEVQSTGEFNQDREKTIGHYGLSILLNRADNWKRALKFRVWIERELNWNYAGPNETDHFSEMISLWRTFRLPMATWRDSTDRNLRFVCLWFVCLRFACLSVCKHCLPLVGRTDSLRFAMSRSLIVTPARQEQWTACPKYWRRRFEDISPSYCR